jgi:hypothetical protein
MRNSCRGTRCLPVLALVSFLLLLGSSSLWAEASREKAAAVRGTMDSLKSAAKRLPAHIRRGLSGGLANVFNMAEKWEQIERLLDDAARAVKQPYETFAVLQAKTEGTVLAAASGSTTQVSDPTQDLTQSRLLAFTQFTTSTAWCGNSTVVGYFDNGSYLETDQSENATSMAGVARSEDAGRTFTDLGYMNPGPVDKDILLGNPVVKCVNANTFYYSSLFSGYNEGGATDLGIRVSKSTDGGKTWANPVPVVEKSSDTHILDHPWMATDPANPKRIYITYAHFDTGGLSGTPTICPAGTTTNTIELVQSTDGGITWSAKPKVIAKLCVSSSSPAMLQGPQVAVGPEGQVYVAWQSDGNTTAEREIHIRKSTDAGRTFKAPVKVSSVVPIGAAGMMQGFFTINQHPVLAVDPRVGRRNVYIAWSDGRFVKAKDVFGEDGSYHYADILITRSIDGGATWLENPIKVNQNKEPLPSGRGTDQFLPAIAVDKKGRLGACFYDRRADANNFLMQRYCAYSVDFGSSWKEIRVTSNKYLPVHLQDAMTDITNIGEYDTLTADLLKINPGFIGAYADSSARSNMDVKAARFSF